MGSQNGSASRRRPVHLYRNRSMNQMRSSRDEPSGGCRTNSKVAVPLTPALFRRERDPRRDAPHRAALQNQNCCPMTNSMRIICGWMRFSLSLGERVGVRGKGTCELVGVIYPANSSVIRVYLRLSVVQVLFSMTKQLRLSFVLSFGAATLALGQSVSGEAN